MLLWWSLFVHFSEEAESDRGGLVYKPDLGALHGSQESLMMTEDSITSADIDLQVLNKEEQKLLVPSSVLSDDHGATVVAATVAENTDAEVASSGRGSRVPSIDESVAETAEEPGKKIGVGRHKASIFASALRRTCRWLLHLVILSITLPSRLSVEMVFKDFRVCTF